MDAQRTEERAGEIVDLGLGVGFEKYRECPVSALVDHCCPSPAKATGARLAGNDREVRIPEVHSALGEPWIRGSRASRQATSGPCHRFLLRAYRPMWHRSPPRPAVAGRTPATAGEPPEALRGSSWALHQAELSQERLVIPVVRLALDAALFEAGEVHILEHERLSGRRDVPSRRG